jgi:hypothetical protein
VLLANPRWERRFVKFLELSGVGRTMADGTDENGARAARMDEWVIWEGRPTGLICIPFPYSSLSLCKGSSYPETCAQRTAEGGGFLLSKLTGRGPEAGSLCFS